MARCLSYCQALAKQGQSEAMQSPELVKEALDLIDVLLPHIGRLRENEAQFVNELHAKVEQYVVRTYLSDKQMNWLRGLAKDHVPDPRQTSFL